MDASLVRVEMERIRRKRQLFPYRWKSSYSIAIVLPLIFVSVSFWTLQKRPLSSMQAKSQDLRESSHVDDPSAAAPLHTTTYDVQDTLMEQYLKLPIASKNRTYPLVDFAIVGFAKCGTTMIEEALRIPNHTWMSYEENHDLQPLKKKLQTTILKFVQSFDRKGGKMSPDGKRRIKTAFKAPDFVTTYLGLSRLEVLSPDTNYLVSTRHPVRMFESFYNYRTQKKAQKKRMKPSTELIGSCGRDCKLLTPDECVVDNDPGVCTDRALYHEHLSRLGMTPMTSKEELDLLNHHTRSIHPNMKGGLFLVEETQLRDVDDKRLHQLQRDMETFLGLDPNVVEWDLNNMVNHNTKKIKTIDICDEEHESVREVLVEIGLKSSTWIRDFLLKSPRVTVPNKEHFLELIEKWKHDPCDDIASAKF